MVLWCSSFSPNPARMRWAISILLGLLVLSWVQPAWADTWKMSCKNPGDSYLVLFEPEARIFMLDPDTDASTYTVLALEGSKVAGAVGYDSGMTFLADFGREPRVDYYIGREIVQTDLCVPVEPSPRYGDGDNLLACLMGKAAVEMRRGANAEAALEMVRTECINTNAEPEPSEEPEGEWGDYLDHVLGIASQSLEAMEKAQVF